MNKCIFHIFYSISWCFFLSYISKEHRGVKQKFWSNNYKIGSKRISTSFLIVGCLDKCSNTIDQNETILVTSQENVLICSSSSHKSFWHLQVRQCFLFHFWSTNPNHYLTQRKPRTLDRKWSKFCRNMTLLLRVMASGRLAGVRAIKASSSCCWQVARWSCSRSLLTNWR